jgi:hypothetical protein
MTEPVSKAELTDRLSLIESMIHEGRRTTEHWSWAFVLWGVAYFAAMAWTAWAPHPAFAWPVTMIVAAIVTGFLASSDRHPNKTTLGRAIGAIWIAVGISMFTLFFALSISGHMGDVRIFISIASSILGFANGASAILLRWRAQLASAVGWWIVSVAACFAAANLAIIEFLAAIFLCQIVFGIYGMICEARVRRQRGPAHA